MAGKRKILMIAACPFPANHGTPAAIREMGVELARQGVDVHLLAYPYGQDMPTGGVRVTRLPNPSGKQKIVIGPTKEKPLLDLKLLWLAIRTIRRENSDLIHAHNFEGALIGIVASFVTGKPLIYHAVNQMRDELVSYGAIKPDCLARLLSYALDVLVPRFPHHIIALSRRIREDLLASGIPGHKVTFIPAGVTPGLFADPKPVPIIEAHGLEGRPRVVYAGDIQNFQRLDYLLRAFSLVLKERPEACLMVVRGLDEPYGHWDAYARDCGIGRDSIVWMGPHSLESLPDYIAAADVGVVSRPDTPGVPIKLLNYMMCGVPTVCFESSSKEFRHRKETWVAPDHDVDALALGVLHWLSHPQEAREVAGNARRLLMRNYHWEGLCERVIALYDELLYRV